MRYALMAKPPNGLAQDLRSSSGLILSYVKPRAPRMNSREPVARIKAHAAHDRGLA